MKAYGYTPDAVFAQNWKKLNILESRRRIAPKDLFLIPPDKRPDVWIIGEHNDSAKEIKKRKLDIGVILGARILNPDVIEAFNFGIINLHPGILPDNRGLDNIKWAVIKDIPQGATVHFIDEHIDRGKIVCQDKIAIYPDDTLMDFHIRVQNLEQKLLIDALIGFQYMGVNLDQYDSVEEGQYHSTVPNWLDEKLDDYMIEYKQKRIDYAVR